jgi:hypothetical protein
MILSKKIEVMHAVEQLFIRGAQSLFGVKPNCNLKTTITGVFEQKSQTKSLSCSRWSTIQDLICLL